MQTFTTLFDRLSDRTIWTSRGEKLNITFGDFQQRLFDAIALHNFTMINDCSKSTLVIINRRFKIVNGNCNVVNFGEKHIHRLPRIIRRGGIG